MLSSAGRYLLTTAANHRDRS